MEEVICDECEKDFKIKLRTKDHGITVKEHYFLCTHCKKKYVAFVTDPECRKMQRSIAWERQKRNAHAVLFKNEKISEQEYKKRIDNSVLQVKVIQQKLEPRMSSLKAMYI